MNLLEIWIKDVISKEWIENGGVKWLEVKFNTICHGVEGTSTRWFNSESEWEEFKNKRYYLG